MTVRHERLSVLDWVSLLAVLPPGAFVCYAVYNSESYLASAQSIAIYIGGPLVIAGLLLSTFLFSRDQRQVMQICFWSIVAGLYSFEAYLAYTETREPVYPEGFDRRSKLEVIADMRARGVMAFPAVTPKNFHDAGLELRIDGVRLLPLGGVPQATIVHCNESGKFRIYQSDRFGFANEDDAWDGPVRVALVGDSYVQGACVQPPDTITENLRKFEPDVVNVGAQGDGPLSELASLREYLAPYRPAIVIWFFYYNDLLQDLFREMTDPVPNYLNPEFHQNLRDQEGRIGGAMRVLVDQLYEKAHLAHRNVAMAAVAGDVHGEARDQAHFRRINPLNYISGLTLRRTRQRLGLYEGGGDWRPPDLKTFRRVLETANKQVDAWGGELYFVALPSWDAAVGSQEEYIHRYHQDGIAVAREVGLRTLDLTEAFRSHPDPAALFANRQPNHYSEAGYALVAERIHDWALN